MQFNDLLNAICEAIKTRLPELKVCEIHGGRFTLDELKKISTRAPAVYVALLGTDAAAAAATGQPEVPLKLAVFIVAKDEVGLSRTAGALNLVEVLLQMVKNDTWQQPGVLEARSITTKNFYNGDLHKSKIALWGVSWVQPILLGDAPWLDGNPVNVTIYASRESKQVTS
ncbi:Uncharacterised protein [BD1-7 clade bacterium]|uniref:Uncharacterized protein n=1 Tax=BD1-7 clade bacterium TaxID=2029982 RepID=A0A5S9Q2F6_9GAMM|nr:Uncharacterised protein [BD1-7 clade bacterium]CAA0111743.1 Uncharacterised protein [BD1-7 clade bacterium]